MADVPYGLANPTQEALQNAAGLSTVLSGAAPNGTSMADLAKMRLAYAFQHAQTQFESNLAMQRAQQANAFEVARQASQQGFEKEQQATGIKAQAALQTAAQSGETSREQLRIGAEKELAQQTEQREIDQRNAMLADQIRLDPRSKLLPGFDLSQYKPNSAKDNAQLIQDWQKSTTPAALEKVDATQVANLRKAASDIQTEITSYPNSTEGQAMMVRSLLSDPHIQQILTSDHNVKSPTGASFYGWGPQDFSNVVAGANVPEIDPKTGQPTGRTMGMAQLSDALSAAQKGYLFGTDAGKIAAIQTAMMQARSSLYSPQTMPPYLQQRFSNLQNLTQAQQAIIGAGNIRTPEGWKQATGSSTPLADALRAAGAGAAPQASGAGLAPTPSQAPATSAPELTSAYVPANLVAAPSFAPF